MKRENMVESFIVFHCIGDPTAPPLSSCVSGIYELMEISVVGFSCGDDLDKKESLALLIDESRDTSDRGGMDVRHHGVEDDIEFWPIEHPMEPPDEDRPVKCPVPDSSIMNNGGMREERFGESMRKRVELSAPARKERVAAAAAAAAAAEPPLQGVRKRHHTLTRGEHSTITPLMRMPPLSALPTHNITIFQMLQQFNEFES